MRQILDERGLAMLFTQARTQNGWRDETIEDELLKAIYALAKIGPTSANCSLGRFVFIRSREGKQKPRPALSKGNIEKTMTAPATVIVAHDVQFFDMLPRLFPHADARTWFAEPAVAAETAMRSRDDLEGRHAHQSWARRPVKGSRAVASA